MVTISADRVLYFSITCSLESVLLLSSSSELFLKYVFILFLIWLSRELCTLFSIKKSASSPSSLARLATRSSTGMYLWFSKEDYWMIIEM